MHHVYRAFNDCKNHYNVSHLLPFFVDIQENEITNVCSWKFQHYDKDNDESLSSSDQQNFYEEIYRLIGTKSFEGHFDRLIDTDNNGAISKQEFKDLFNLEEGEIAYIILLPAMFDIMSFLQQVDHSHHQVAEEVSIDQLHYIISYTIPKSITLSSFYL